MSCSKTAFFVFFVVMAFTGMCIASPVPARVEEGNEFQFTAERLLFSPMPWESTKSAQTVSVTLFTISDYTSKTRVTENIIGTTVFTTSGLMPAGDGSGRGDLAIKFMNSSGADRHFDATVMTAHFTEEIFINKASTSETSTDEPFISYTFENGIARIYLPAFDIVAGGGIQFWVGGDGSTYYKGDTEVGMAMAKEIINTESAARAVETPEPGTLLLLGLGGLLIRRKKAAL